MFANIEIDNSRSLGDITGLIPLEVQGLLFDSQKLNTKKNVYTVNECIFPEDLDTDLSYKFKVLFEIGNLKIISPKAVGYQAIGFFDGKPVVAYISRYKIDNFVLLEDSDCIYFILSLFNSKIEENDTDVLNEHLSYQDCLVDNEFEIILVEFGFKSFKKNLSEVLFLTYKYTNTNKDFFILPP